jgi:Epoxide hydrolase N terminus
MASITPFTISIPDAKIQRLQQKLALTDLPSDVSDAANPWSRGVPLADISRLASHWQHGFNWRAVEAKLNRDLPQYTTTIDVDNFGTYDIHFVHQRSGAHAAIPLLFLHGWPSSFLEVAHMLPLLVDGGADSPSFHVVAPSLIDFGFSSASNKVSLLMIIPIQVRHSNRLKKGFNIEQHAEAYHKLMLALGYTEYGTPSPFSSPKLEPQSPNCPKSHPSRRHRLPDNPVYRAEIRPQPLQGIPPQQRRAGGAHRNNPSRAPRQAAQRVRPGRPGAHTGILNKGECILPPPIQPPANPRLQPRGQSCGSARLDIRETRHLERRLCVDGRRGVDVG